VTIKWNLTNIMYNKGVFTVTDLKRLIKDKGNLDISVPAVHRLVHSLPTEIKFTTLDALCAALDCEVDELIEHQRPTPANQCLQPLIVDSGFKPPKKAKKPKEAKIRIKDLPPI